MVKLARTRPLKFIGLLLGLLAVYIVSGTDMFSRSASGEATPGAVQYMHVDTALKIKPGEQFTVKLALQDQLGQPVSGRTYGINSGQFVLPGDAIKNINGNTTSFEVDEQNVKEVLTDQGKGTGIYNIPVRIMGWPEANSPTYTLKAIYKGQGLGTADASQSNQYHLTATVSFTSGDEGAESVMRYAPVEADKVVLNVPAANPEEPEPAPVENVITVRVKPVAQIRGKETNNRKIIGLDAPGMRAVWQEPVAVDNTGAPLDVRIVEITEETIELRKIKGEQRVLNTGTYQVKLVVKSPAGLNGRHGVITLGLRDRDVLIQSSLTVNFSTMETKEKPVENRSFGRPYMVEIPNTPVLLTDTTEFYWVGVTPSNVEVELAEDPETPTNGRYVISAAGIRTEIKCLRLHALIDDPDQVGLGDPPYYPKINAAEFYVTPRADTAPPSDNDGHGYPMIADDGNFNSSTEMARYDIYPATDGDPATLNMDDMAENQYKIWAHGRNEYGVWGYFGPTSSIKTPIELGVDRTIPAVTITTPVAAAPPTQVGGAMVTVNGTYNVNNGSGYNSSLNYFEVCENVNGTTFDELASVPIGGTWGTTWDTGDSGPDGYFTYKARAVDSAGNMSAEATRQVIIDNTKPIAHFASPTQGDGLKPSDGTITITGKAFDPDTTPLLDVSFYRYTVEWAAGVETDTVTWNVLANSTTPVGSETTNGTLATWNVSGLSEGVYTLRVRAYDKAANMNVENPTTPVAYTNFIYVYVDTSTPVSAVTIPYSAGGNWVGEILHGTARDFMNRAGAGRYENDNSVSPITYVGSWDLVETTNNLPSGNSYRWSNVTGRTASFTFYSDHIAWIATRGPDRGLAEVDIDGWWKKNVNLNKPGTTWDYQQVAYQKTWPTAGWHTITITVKATDGKYVDIDAFDVNPGSGVGKVDLRIQRVSDGAWWNGSAWSGTSGSWLTTTINSGVNTPFITDWTYDIGAIAGNTELDIETRAEDDAHNVEPTFPKVRARIDSDKPVSRGADSAGNVIAGNGSLGWYVTPVPALNLRADDPGPSPGAQKLYYQWNSSGTAPTSGWLSWSASLPAAMILHDLTADVPSQGLTLDGVRRLWYYSVDATGNVEAATWREFKRDTQSPTAPTFTTPALPANRNQRSTFTLGGGPSSDTVPTGHPGPASGVNRFEMSIMRNDSSTWWQGGTSWLLSPQYWFNIGSTTWSYAYNSIASLGTDGNHTFYVRAVDEAGNLSSNVSNYYMVDNTVPTTYSTLPAVNGEHGWYKSNIDVSLTPTDPTPGSGTTSALTWWTMTFTPLLGSPVTLWNNLQYSYQGVYRTVDGYDGTYNYNYYSRDNSGNTQLTQNATFQKDSVPPSSTITGPAELSYKRATFAITGTAIDQAPSSTMGRVDIAVKNAAGNWWNGSTISPTWSSGSPTWVTGTSSDGWANWSYNWDTIASAATDGQYTVYSKAVDYAGCEQLVWDHVIVNVDNTPPRVTSFLPVDEETMVQTNTTVRANFSEQMIPSTLNGADTVSSFKLKTNAGAAVAGNVVYTELGGSYYATFTPTSPLSSATPFYLPIVIRGATDLAGNPIQTYYEETTSSAAYTGTWSPVTDANASGGAYKTSATTNDNVIVTFTGTKISWVADKGSDRGIANIYVDSVSAGTVDLYNATRQWQQKVWTSATLTDAPHTLEIRVSGTKNVSSSANTISVDAFAGIVGKPGGDFDTRSRFYPANVEAEIYEPLTGDRVFGSVSVMGRVGGPAYAEYKMQYMQLKDVNGTPVSDTYHDFGSVHGLPAKDSGKWPNQVDWSAGKTTITPAITTTTTQYRDGVNEQVTYGTAVRLKSTGTVWPNRKAITITSTGPAVTNYQARIPISFVSGQMKANYDDVRFTDTNGQDFLSHWREMYDASTAVFWVKIPSIPEGSPANPVTKTIYVYYGNMNAPGGSSDGAAVFDRFDDFGDASINTGLWTTLAGTGSISESGGLLNFSYNGIDNNEWSGSSRGGTALKLNNGLLPSGDFRAVVKLNSYTVNNATMAGISVYNSDTSAYLWGRFYGSPRNWYQLDKAGSSNLANYDNALLPKYLAVTKSGSSYSFSTSVDGATWSQPTPASSYSDVTFSNVVLFGREWYSPTGDSPGYHAFNMDDFFIQRYSSTVAVGSPGSADTSYPISTSYEATGSLTSLIFDAGSSKSWGYVKWSEKIPPGTKATVQIRYNVTGGDSNPEDGGGFSPGNGWSDWSSPITVSAGEQLPSFSSQYIQYRINLFANDGVTRTPVVEDISFFNDVLETWNTVGLPGGDGTYRLRLLATNTTAGTWILVAPGINTVASTVDVIVDNTGKPDSVITSPLNNAYVKATCNVLGTAYDAYPGVGTVQLRIKRSSDGWYWHGTGDTWENDANNWLTTSETVAFSNFRNWQYAWDTLLLDGAAVVFHDGLYTLESRATDKAGAVEDTPNNPIITVTVDNTAPTASIAVPLTNSFVSGGYVSVDGAVGDPPADANFQDYKLEYKRDNATVWTTISNPLYAHPRMSTSAKNWQQTTDTDFNTGTMTGFAVRNTGAAADLTFDNIAFQDDFTGTTINATKWTEVDNTSNYITQNGTLNNSGGNSSWVMPGLYTKANFDRSTTECVEADINVSQPNYYGNYYGPMFGFKNTTEDPNYTTYAHAIYLFKNSYYGQAQGVQIYENGSPVGGTYLTLNQGTTYKYRIRLKATAGAYYEYSTNGGTSWNLIVETSSVGTGQLKAGVSVHSQAFTMDNFFVYKRITSPSYFTSQVYDAGSSINWGTANLSWTESNVNGTTKDITVQTRSGATATAGDQTWSDWNTTPYTTPGGQTIASPAGRYIQYRAKFTGLYNDVPLLSDIRAAYTGGTGATQLEWWQTAGLLDGKYALRLTATDKAGNETIVTSNPVTVDKVAPHASLDTLGNQGYIRANAAITGTADDGYWGTRAAVTLTNTTGGTLTDYQVKVPVSWISGAVLPVGTKLIAGTTSISSTDTTNIGGTWYLSGGVYTLTYDRTTITAPVTLQAPLKAAIGSQLPIGTTVNAGTVTTNAADATAIAAIGNWTLSGGVYTLNTNQTTSGSIVTLNAPLTTAAGMRTDFSDIRFVDVGGARLNHWVESYTTGTSAVVWVNVPSLPNGGKVINMYYGNYDGQNQSSLVATTKPAGTYSTVELTGGAGLWHFNDNWNDSSGNSNNGTPDNGAWFSANKILGTKSGLFDGIDDYVQAANSASLNLSGSALTVEAWVYPTQNKSSAIIINKENSYEVALNNGVFQAAIETAATGSWAWGGTKTVPLNTWSHLTFVHDGTYWYFYINGVLEERIAPAGAQTGNITASALPLGLGGRYNSGTFGSFFSGLLDEVKLSAAVLDSATIMRDAGIRQWTTLTEPTGTVGAREAQAPIIDNFDYYDLTYTGAEAGNIGTSLTPSVTMGTLATWNTRLRKDGDYTIKLYMVDKAKNTATATTNVKVDNTPPRITSTFPVNGELYADPAVEPIAYFSEDLRSETVTTLTYLLSGATGSVRYTKNGYSYFGTYDPTLPLACGSTHTGTLKTDIIDIAGNPIAKPFEENDASVTYPVGFAAARINNTNASGEYYKQSATTGDTARIAFTTTATANRSLVWLSATGPDYGYAQVWLDDVLQGTADLYSASTAWQQSVYKLGEFSVGAHHVDIVLPGTKNGASTGYKVDIDAFLLDNDYTWTFDIAGVKGAITSPVLNQRVKGSVPIVGTADDESSGDWHEWTLQYAQHGQEVSGPWNDIGTNPRTNKVTNATLDTWNTTGLNGQYTIRLKVIDITHHETNYDVLVTVDNTAPTGSVSRMAIFNDYFDSKDAGSWTFSATHQAAPVPMDGSNTLRAIGTGSSWGSNFYRSNGLALTDKDEVTVDFKATDPNSGLHLMLESTSPEGNYLRWCITNPDSGTPGQLIVQYKDAGNYQFGTLTGLTYTTGTWYRATFKINDDAGSNFEIDVEERANPTNHAHFTAPMVKGMLWMFHSYIWRGAVYIDNYEEKRPAAGSVRLGQVYRAMGTATDTMSGIDRIETKLDSGPWQPAYTSAVIEPSDAITGWTGNLSGNSVTLNNTTFIEGTGALNLVKGNVTSATATYEKTITSVSLANKRLSVWVNINANMLAKINNMKLYAMNSAGTWSMASPAITNSQLTTGWNVLSFDTMDPAATTGSFDVKQITKVKLEAVTNNITDVTTVNDVFIMDKWAVSASYRVDQEFGVKGAGLVGEWHLDEGTGVMAVNTAPTTGINGFITGTSFWTSSSALGAYALSFSGNDDQVMVPDNAALRLGTVQTVETWVKVTASASDWVGLVAKGQDGGTENYGLWLATDGTIQYEFQNAGGTNYYARTTDLKVNDTVWHHIAATYDGANIKIYVDGMLGATTACTATPVTGATSLTIGYTGKYARLVGAIDEPKVYNTALSADEVAARFAEGQSSAFVQEVSYAGDWRYVTATNASGGSLKTSDAAGSSTTIRFKGSSITWVANRQSDRGVAQVLIDGVAIEDGNYHLGPPFYTDPTGKNSGIDLYSQTEQWRSLVYTKTGLNPAAWHTMTIKVTGYKNGASTATTINADGYDISGDREFRYNVDTTGLAAGNHTVAARAFDRAGNVADLTSFTFSVDADTPVASIDGLGDAQIVATAGSLANNTILRAGTRAATVTDKTTIGGTWVQLAGGAYVLISDWTISGGAKAFTSPLTIAASSYIATGSTLNQGTTAVYNADTTAIGGTWTLNGATYTLGANRTLPAGTNVTLQAFYTNSLSIGVSGQATDSNLNYYLLEYGYGSSPTAWTQVNKNPRYYQVTGTAPDNLLGYWRLPSLTWYGWDKNDAEGWTFTNMGTNQHVSNGAIGATTTSADPQLTGPTGMTAINGNKIKTIRIKMKQSAIGSGRAQLYWDYDLAQYGGGDYSGNPYQFMSGGHKLYIYEPWKGVKGDTTYHEQKSLSWDLGPDANPNSYINKWVEYELDMGSGRVYGIPRTETVAGTTGITPTGTWSDVATDYSSGGSERQTTTGGSTLTYSFISPNITLFASKAADMGIAKILIDGVAITDGTTALSADAVGNKSGVDLYARITLGQQPVYSKLSIPRQTSHSLDDHTITIEYTGQKNTASSSAKINVDAFQEKTLVQDYVQGAQAWQGVGFWQGNISTLRLDPTNANGVAVEVDYINYDPPDGVYKVRLTAADRAGRRSTDTHTVNIDTTPPKSITQSPENLGVLGSATVNITGVAGDYLRNGVKSDVDYVETRIIRNVSNLSAKPDDWVRAGTSNSWANWTKTVTLAEGWFGVQARTVDKAGNIRESNINYVTLDTTAPSQPLLRVMPSKRTGHEGILLSWTPAKDEGTGVDYYIVLRNKKGVVSSLKYPDQRTIDEIDPVVNTVDLNNPHTPGNPADDTSFIKFYACNAIDPAGYDAQSDVDVRYSVIAVDGTGKMSTEYIDFLTSVRAKYDTIGPEKPTGLTVDTAGTTNMATLAWNSLSYDEWKNQGVSEYRVYRSTDQGFVLPDETKLVGVCDVADPSSGATTATKFYDPNLTWGETYYYKVVAYDDASPMNESPPSEEAWVTIAPARIDWTDALPHRAYSAAPAECAICHRAHSSQGDKQIALPTEADLCFTCHDGTASNTPTKAEFDYSPSGAHRVRDELYPEGRLSCIDCHNPHLNTENAYFDNFDDDNVGTQPDSWVCTGGSWAISGTATTRELTQSSTSLVTAYTKRDTLLTNLNNKGGLFSTQVKMTSDGTAFLAVGSDGTGMVGILAKLIRTGASAYLQLDDGDHTANSATFAYDSNMKYRIRLKITPDKQVESTVSKVEKGDLPDSRDTVTDTELAKISTTTTDAAYKGTYLEFGTVNASANFDIVKINNPGMLQTRYREFAGVSVGGGSYSVPDDRIQTEAFCLSCHGSSYDAPGGSQQQYYTSAHNPTIGGTNDQALDQDSTTYIKTNPALLTPRWQEIRDSWKDLRTNPAYKLTDAPDSPTIGSLLRHTSNACFYCHGYHGLQFYSRTQSGEEELCYICHGKIANKSRDGWNIYQQYNGYTQDTSYHLKFYGTWTSRTEAQDAVPAGSYSGGTIKYATGATISPTWYNGCWAKRKRIKITNAGAAIDNYSAKLSIAQTSDMNSDFSDLRFTASDGTTERKFWLEGTYASSANVWVYLPTLATGDNYIYVYYDNPNADSASNMKDSFIFADDFIDSQLGLNWTTSGTISATNGWVTLDRKNNVNVSMTSDFTAIPANNFAVEAKFRLNQTNFRLRPRLTKTSGVTPAPGDYGYFEQNSTYPRDVHWNGVWSNITLGYIPTTYVMQYAVQYSPFNFTWATYNYTNYATGTLVAGSSKSSALNPPSGDYQRISFDGSESDTSDWQIDWVRVRKVPASEPTVTYEAEQAGNPGVSLNFTGTTTFVVSVKGPTKGQASIYIDNVHAQDIDLYAAAPAYRQEVYANKTLSTGAHTINVVAESGRVDVDAIQGEGVGSRHGLTLKEATIKCTSCHGQRAMTDRHTWETGYKTSNVADPENIKGYWSDQRQKGKTINDYCNACHKMPDTKGRVLREKHTSTKIVPYDIKYPPLITTSSANGFDRTGYTVGDVYVTQEYAVGITKVAPERWLTDAPGTEDFDGGEAIYNVTGLDYLEYTFTGDSIEWITKLGPDCGIAQVFIDGSPWTEGTVHLAGDADNENSGVDLYSGTTTYRYTAAKLIRLSLAGSHTIKIINTGTRNPLATDGRVYLDSFKYAIPRVGHYLYAPIGPKTKMTGVGGPGDPTHFNVASVSDAQLVVGDTLVIDPENNPHAEQTAVIIGIVGSTIEIDRDLSAAHVVDCVVSNFSKASCAGNCHVGYPFETSQEAKTKITCITCHHPHASENARTLRWPADSKSGQTVSKGGCLHCHDGSVPY